MNLLSYIANCIFSRASRMLRVATQVVRMPCVCMYVCVCVCGNFFPNDPPILPFPPSEARQYTARYSSSAICTVDIAALTP